MRRTNTAERTTFNLPPPNEATLSFSTDCQKMNIAIPAGGGWRMPLHWHANSNLGCISVRCLQGRLRVYQANDRTSGDRLGGPGIIVNFQPGQRVTWCSATSRRGGPGCTEDWSVELTVADQNLYRNTSSTILDQDVYPYLTSTPYWIRLVFSLLRYRSHAREAFLSFLLWVQLEMIMYCHGFHRYHGEIHITWPWVAQPFGGRPPRWAIRLRVQTWYVISRLVMGSCYWLGWLLLGMKDEYEEYTARRATVKAEEPDEKDFAV